MRNLLKFYLSSLRLSLLPNIYGPPGSSEGLIPQTNSQNVVIYFQKPAPLNEADAKSCYNWKLPWLC